MSMCSRDQPGKKFGCARPNVRHAERRAPVRRAQILSHWWMRPERNIRNRQPQVHRRDGEWQPCVMLRDDHPDRRRDPRPLPRQGQAPHRFVPAPVAGHPRGTVEADRETIDVSMNQTRPLVAWFRGRPLSPPGPSRWCGCEQSAADQSPGRCRVLGTAENVKKARGRPAAERDAGEQRVNGMAKPLTTQQPAGPPTAEHCMVGSIVPVERRCVLEP